MPSQIVDSDMIQYLDERKSAWEKVQKREALEELLKENRQKGFPGDTEALVQWCREREVCYYSHVQ